MQQLADKAFDLLKADPRHPSLHFKRVGRFWSARGATSYLFNAYALDFRRYLDRADVARLVARNIRYELGKSIGRKIQDTCEKHPADFWYFHNGVTVVCDDFEERDRKARLTNPSVINGAQTLYAISHSSDESSPARLPARVIVRRPESGGSADDDEWLQKIIRAVNTQNRVYEYDFRSNEPEQVLLQQQFRELSVFYERKRGEWAEYRNDPRYKGFRKLSLLSLAQILTATADDSGEGVLLTKQGAEKIFQDAHYEKLFPSRAKVGYRFLRMYVAYRVAELLASSGYAGAKEARRMRHAFWNTLWLLHRGLMSQGGLTEGARPAKIKRAFDTVGKARGGKGAGQTVRRVVKAVWRTWRSARKRRTELTPNNFFKSKDGNRRLLRAAYPKVSRDLRDLATRLVRAATQQRELVDTSVEFRAFRNSAARKFTKAVARGVKSSGEWLVVSGEREG